MKSTMQDVQLGVAGIVEHAATVHGEREVFTERGPRDMSRVTYRELAVRAARLANALREVGVRGDERVVIVDDTLLGVLAAALPTMASVQARGRRVRHQDPRLIISRSSTRSIQVWGVKR
ncbi:MAG: AMP-binding protein [Mycobacterium sp.]|uniref:AMP-binding protein n=1 Tax=Mycobacterium sp. TaxID=1785 RepID=UPI00260F54DF|nr:AMP-binding protein [Mycobacterium sp.]MDI3315220.1 AMP-binding protein [Mycobacterium sp.]